MAIETLKDVQLLDGHTIQVVGEPNIDAFITIDHDKNTILFKIQKNPVREGGMNGCQVDTLIAAATQMIFGLNSQLPCRENSIAITKLEEAYMWLKARKRDRIYRGVEGTKRK